MRHEWLSVQIDAHSLRGTETMRGVFPCSNVASIQIASVSAVMAQIWETVDLMTAGQVISMDISVSLPQTMELDETEAMLVEKYKKKRGYDRWDRFFKPVHALKGGSNGEGS